MTEQHAPGLPKWPQMRVTGARLTPEKALEVIRRTDSFFTQGYGGNDRRWNAWVKATVGMPSEPEYPSSENLPEKNQGLLKRVNAYFDELDAWRTKWGCIRGLDYVYNGWVSNAFIFGPSGWCHPDGTIFFEHNVGKWPSVEEVAAEWKLLAEAFPFLEVDIELMSGEDCEDDTRPVVNMQVRNGEVTWWEPIGPQPYVMHSKFGGWSKESSIEDAIQRFAYIRENRIARWEYPYEHGIAESVIIEWARVNA